MQDTIHPSTTLTFDPGARLDRLDPRDYKWSEVASSLPPFDWNTPYSVLDEIKTATKNPGFTVNAKNQNGSGSCGGQAWSYYGASLESIFTGSYEERSAKFIYAQTHVPGGGSAGRDNCNLVINQGWGLESDTPSYENGMAPGEYFMERSQDITDVARENASKSKALSYASVDTNIDTIAQACKANHGVILGIVGSNNATWLSDAPKPPKDGDYLWYHWIYAGEAGMYNGEKAIHVLNSWGNVAGTHGWQWLTESYLNTVLTSDPYHGNTTIFSAWTLMYRKQPDLPASFTHHFATPMQLGDSNAEVLALQHALSVTGDFTIDPTGFYGTITAGAVYKFQLRNGISPTARNNVGPKTMAALNALFDR